MSGVQPREKHVSITQVAKRAGVSYQTVSRVINRSPNVSPQTRQKVQKAIEELDYHPLNFARALVTRRSHLIGFAAGGVSYYGPISTIGALETRARDHGLAVMVSVFDERHRGRTQFASICSSFAEQGVDAFVYLVPTNDLLEAALDVKTSRPAVFLTSASTAAVEAAQQADPSARRFVGIDQQRGEEQILDVLARSGRTRILILTGPQQWADASSRLSACVQGAQKRGVHYEVCDVNSWQSQAAEEAVMDVFSSSSQADRPNAVIAANDLQALGAIRALKRCGLSVPDDVSVTGFDDMPGANASLPSLTTIRPDFQALGSLAMLQVLQMFGAADDGEGPIDEKELFPSLRVVSSMHLLAPQLIERESTHVNAD